MSISNKTLRDTLRVIHILMAALVGGYLYSPLSEVTWFAGVVKLTVLPVFLITGLSMWKMPFLTKMLKRRPAPVSHDA